MLFHYTVDDNFERIQRNKKISLTKSTSSNDEFDTVYITNLLKLHSHEIFSEVFSSKDFRDTDNLPNVDSFIRFLVGYIAFIFKDIKSSNIENIKSRKCFVICFAEKSDSRFLWEAYAKDNGVNFGIELKKYKEFLSKNYSDLQSSNVDMKFEQVIYKEDEQKKALKKISKRLFVKHYINIDELSNVRTRHQGQINLIGFNDAINSSIKLNPIEITLKQWAINFIAEYTNELLLLAPYLKHPFWKEEAEYRLCIFRHQNQDGLEAVKSFERIQTGENVEFIELPLPYEQLEKITIGPLSKFVDEYDTLDISKSKVQKIVSQGHGVKRY